MFSQLIYMYYTGVEEKCQEIFYERTKKCPHKEGKFILGISWWRYHPFDPPAPVF